MIKYGGMEIAFSPKKVFVGFKPSPSQTKLHALKQLLQQRNDKYPFFRDQKMTPRAASLIRPLKPHSIVLSNILPSRQRIQFRTHR